MSKRTFPVHSLGFLVKILRSQQGKSTVKVEDGHHYKLKISNNFKSTLILRFLNGLPDPALDWPGLAVIRCDIRMRAGLGAQAFPASKICLVEQTLTAYIIRKTLCCLP
jgi:hypothetical protein